MRWFNALTKINLSTLACVILSCCLYLYLGYFFEREDFIFLIGVGAILFTCSWYMFSKCTLSLSQLNIVGLLFRAIFIFTIPFLSQDFYRFVWDGHLLAQGKNPYLLTPDQWMLGDVSHIPNAQLLYEKMGSLSAGHYTNYPPLNQVCFGVASFLGGNSLLTSVVVLRLIIISADIGITIYGTKLLGKLSLPPKNILLYTLNPLVLLELTGNLHFEGVMVFFVLLSVYTLIENQWKTSALLLAAAVVTKLIPLIFLPLFLFNLGWKRWIGYCVIVGLVIVLSFIPFLSPQMIENFGATVALWFANFEFNASIYYLLRSLGFWITGYNEIAIIGKVLTLIVFIAVWVITFIHKPNKSSTLIASMLAVIALYFFLATTVHPWYLITPLLLSVFTRFRFVWVWSAMVLLSYSAYAHPSFQENYWLLALEYSVVFAALIIELSSPKKLSLTSTSV